MVRLAERMQGVDPNDPSTMEEYVALLSDATTPRTSRLTQPLRSPSSSSSSTRLSALAGGANGFGQTMQRPELSAAVERAFPALAPIEERAQTCEEYAPT